jgi:ABC-2 type transport system ATP-binding protein
VTQRPIIKISNLNKTYSGGFQALRNINLEIHPGEIFALLGPNGAGKTTLISIICGINRATSGQIQVDGFDIEKNYRETRSLIGLVPQELTTDAFESVWNSVKFTRGLFNLPPNPAYLEEVLKSLSLWEKKDNRLMTLSGGMKRRLMIAKALSHEPRVLFLDEPTAGVDVELRKDMWALVHQLRQSGVTIILTTHYIEEAEEMADRVGVINNGELILTEETRALMKKMGSKQMTVELSEPLDSIPSELSDFDLCLQEGHLVYSYDSRREDNGVARLLDILGRSSLCYKDIVTRQSSLEEIFVELVRRP